MEPLLLQGRAVGGRVVDSTEAGEEAGALGVEEGLEGALDVGGLAA